MNMPAKVVTKAGTLILVTKSPWYTPTPIPQSSTMGTTSHTCKPFISRMAAMAPRKPATKPTDRSMCRIIRIRVMPMARTAT